MYYINFFFFKQKTAYEMRISDWSSDVCSSDLQCDEHGVACGVAEIIIDRLEIVGVDEQQRKTAAARRSGVDAPRELFIEGGAVRHRGQRVVRRAVGEHRVFVFHMALPALQFVEQGIDVAAQPVQRSEEHTTELQSLLRI